MLKAFQLDDCYRVATCQRVCSNLVALNENYHTTKIGMKIKTMC